MSCGEAEKLLEQALEVIELSRKVDNHLDQRAQANAGYLLALATKQFLQKLAAEETELWIL